MNKNKALGNHEFNFFTLFLLVISIIYVTWGAMNMTEIGLIYFFLFAGSILVLYIIQLGVKENDKNFAKDYIRSVFTGNGILAVFFWYVGFVGIHIINMFGRIFDQSFSTTQFFSPLFSAGGLVNTVQSQSYQAAVIENSPIANWIYGIFIAGNVEEVLFGYAIPIIFYTLTILFINQALNGKTPLGLKKDTFSTIISIIGSIILFAFIHKLNDTYIAAGIGMFIISAIFRLFMNISLYVWGLPLAFTIGIHSGSNNVAYMIGIGKGSMLAGSQILLNLLTSSFTGWIFLIFVVLVTIFLLVKFDIVKREFNKWWAVKNLN